MIFEDVAKYVEKSLEDRQAHLDLQSECIEIGTTSTQCRGLLSHYLKVTVPKGSKIVLCHKCNNALCSNPQHLYYGTARENRLDAVEAGAFSSPWEASVAKYGLEEAKKRNSKTGFKKGNTLGSKGNKGRPKSEEQKKKTSESVKKSWKKRRK